MPKALGLSLSSSSPSIAQKPPIGKSLNEYMVSPFLNLRILGPIPRANSLTLTPDAFAVIKCPSSCMKIISSKSKTPIIIRSADSTKENTQTRVIITARAAKTPA